MTQLDMAIQNLGSIIAKSSKLKQHRHYNTSEEEDRSDSLVHDLGSSNTLTVICLELLKSMGRKSIVYEQSVSQVIDWIGFLCCWKKFYKEIEKLFKITSIITVIRFDTNSHTAQEISQKTKAWLMQRTNSMLKFNMGIEVVKSSHASEEAHKKYSIKGYEIYKNLGLAIPQKVVAQIEIRKSEAS